MKRNFAAWFAIMSMVSAMKSKIWTSTTGRIPAMAAPTPQPTNAASEIGVSRTRASPNSRISPALTEKMPPVSPTSSPIRNTRSSRAISWRSASFSAWVNAICRSPGGGGAGVSTRGA